MAKWTLWLAKLEIVVDCPPHSCIQPSPVNLQCGLIPWRWATELGGLFVFSMSSVKESRNLGSQRLSGTARTHHHPPAPSSRALTQLTNLKLHHLQNLLAKTHSAWTIFWTPRSLSASSSWRPWCPARPPPSPPSPPQPPWYTGPHQTYCI